MILLNAVIHVTKITFSEVPRCLFINPVIPKSHKSHGGIFQKPLGNAAGQNLPSAVRSNLSCCWVLR